MARKGATSSAAPTSLQEDGRHKWEGDITDVFRKFIDLDINQAHQTEIDRLLE